MVLCSIIVIVLCRRDAKSNQLERVPDLRNCAELRVL